MAADHIGKNRIIAFQWSAPTAEKEQFTGIGWRSLSDMDGAADDMLLGATDDSFPDAGFSGILIRMERYHGRIISLCNFAL